MPLNNEPKQLASKINLKNKLLNTQLKHLCTERSTQRLTLSILHDNTVDKNKLNKIIAQLTKSFAILRDLNSDSPSGKVNEMKREIRKLEVINRSNPSSGHYFAIHQTLCHPWSILTISGKCFKIHIAAIILQLYLKTLSLIMMAPIVGKLKEADRKDIKPNVKND